MELVSFLHHNFARLLCYVPDCRILNEKKASVVAPYSGIMFIPSFVKFSQKIRDVLEKKTVAHAESLVVSEACSFPFHGSSKVC